MRSDLQSLLGVEPKPKGFTMVFLAGFEPAPISVFS